MTINAVEEKEKNNWTLTLPLLPQKNNHTIRRLQRRPTSH